jgi:protein TonB
MQLPESRKFEFDLPALEERIRRMDKRRIKYAFIGAVLLHASLALGFITWDAEPVSPPGEMVITVDLAPAIASAATDPIAGESTESAPQQALPEPAPLREEKAIEQTPMPAPEIIQEETAEALQEEKAEVALKQKQKEEQKSETKPKPKPQAPQQAASSASVQRADIGGSGSNASPLELAEYIGRLRSALERSKRYPASAGGASGTVSLRFTVNRSGAVTGHTITRSSGNAALDGAVRSMIQNASLPSIPEGLPNSITVGVPVNFRVR